MKSLFPLLLICTLFLFTNCDNTHPDPDAATPSLASIADTMKSPGIINAESLMPVTTLTANGKRNHKTLADYQLEDSIDMAIIRQLEMHPDLPALNTVAAAYNNITVKLFSSIAAATGGETYLIDNASLVVNAISEIITSYMSSETDLVFLIDKTGSMEDDIAEVKKSMNTIIDALKPFDNSRVGFAFYGDKYADTSAWYSIIPLNNDFTACKEIIRSIGTTGGGDAPESVNDGIAKTIDSMNWGDGRRRMILLIGDAPSLEPPYADYSLEDIIALAKSQKVQMNFYPVVIGLQGSVKGISKPKEIKPKTEKMLSSIAPNPAVDHTVIRTSAAGDHTLEIYTAAGRLVSSFVMHEDTYELSTASYANGVYIVRIINNTDVTVDTGKFIVSH